MYTTIIDEIVIKLNGNKFDGHFSNGRKIAMGPNRKIATWVFKF